MYQTTVTHSPDRRDIPDLNPPGVSRLFGKKGGIYVGYHPGCSCSYSARRSVLYPADRAQTKISALRPRNL